MELHEIKSVTDNGDGTYCVKVDITDVNGDRYVTDYGVVPGDSFGLAPIIKKAVEDWVAAGNEITPIAPPDPEEVRAAMPTLTARQFRLGLIDGGIDLADVETAIAAIPDPVERKKGQVEWEYATQFNRLHPLVVQLSSSLGLTPEQVDAMWGGAAAL